MDPFQKGGETRRKMILEALECYPYSFKMKGIGIVKHKAFEGLKNHLEAGLKAGYSTSLQTASARNLLAFVLFQLGEHFKALEESENVLKMDDQQNNIVSLANKAYILSKLNSFDEAEDVVGDLKELQATSEFDYLLVKAKAELAVSYMRFGPRFNKHAIDAFKEVLPQAKEPEVWMWKFSLAVSYRHALDLQHAPYVSRGQYTINHRDSLDLLQEVIDSRPTTGGEAAWKNLKANAYAEMGLLLHLTWDKTTEYTLCSQVQIGPMASCKKALGLDDNDASVLWKSGKLHRNFKDLFKSKKLLEKAVRLQPSSAAYHHLGLTYKAMATNLQYGKLKTRRGGKIQKQRRKAREEKMKNQEEDTGAAMQPKFRKGPSPFVSAREYREREKVERIKKAVKSPKDVTHFDPQEHNVLQAIENLERSIDFSARENSRAVYDLALMYTATKNFNEALKLFKEVAQRQNGEIATPSGLLEQITSLEQMGLIYKQMAGEEKDEEKKRKLTRDSERRLNGALSLAANLYSSTESIKDIFGEVFHSPSALLQAADASGKSDEDKRKTKTKIYSLINNHKQSQALLNDFAEKDQDPELIKLKMDVYYRKGDYETAAALLTPLKSTEQYSKVIKLYEPQRDVHSVFDIYFNAGRQALTHGPCDAGYFTGAFRQEVNPPEPKGISTSSSSAEDCTSIQGASHTQKGPSQSGWEELWDVMLLHDEEDDDIENKAVKLGDILKTACGLRVVRRTENFLPGTREFNDILENIEHSMVVVVLPGSEKWTPQFEEAVSVAAPFKSTVVLQTEGTRPEPELIPRELRPPLHRHMTCPTELFVPDIHAAGPYTEEFISAICRLFQFLADRE